jgi:hypothetical protein
LRGKARIAPTAGLTARHARAPIQRLQISFTHADELLISRQTATAKSESCLDSSISPSFIAALAWLTADSESCR